MPEVAIKLRKKYIKGLRYKNQKSKSNNQGHNRPKKVVQPQKKLVGQKVFLLNMSDEDQFCAYTGLPLPKRGMVVKNLDRYYIDFAAAEAGANG